MNYTRPCPCVHPDDIACENAFPAVPYDSPEWTLDDDHITPHDAVLLYQRNQPLRFFELPVDDEPFSADAPDVHLATGDNYWLAMMADGITPLPAISGGALDGEPPVVDQPYQPTETDWLEYRRIFDEQDQAGELDGTDAMRAWYATHPLAEFNAERVD